MRLIRGALLAWVVTMIAVAPASAEILVYTWKQFGPVCVSYDSGETFTKNGVKQRGYMVVEYIPDLATYQDATVVRKWKIDGEKFSAKGAFMDGNPDFQEIQDNKGRDFLLISDFNGLNNGSVVSGRIKDVKAKQTGGSNDVSILKSGKGQAAYSWTFAGGRVEMGGGNTWLRYNAKRTKDANLSGQTVAEVVDDLLNEIQAQGYGSVIPTAVDDEATTTVDVPVTVDVLSNDQSNNGETLTVNRLVTLPSNGEAVINENSTITYTPNAGWFGKDSFIYEIIDESNGTDQATVTITVNFDRNIELISQVVSGSSVTAADGASTTCNGYSYYGRFVFFKTNATNLASSSSSVVPNLVIYDRSLNTFERCNEVGAEVSGNAQNIATQRRVISDDTDGRYVVFSTGNRNSTFPNVTYEAVYMFDRDTSVDTPFILISCDNDAELNGPAKGGCMSAHTDTAYTQVTYYSSANNLVANDTNDAWDVFVHNPQATNYATRISVSTSGEQADGDSLNPAIDGTGVYVTFESDATNLVDGDTNNCRDVFLHNRDTSGSGTFDTSGNILTTRISASNDGTQGNGDSYANSISSDGRYITFTSSASNLVDDDTNGSQDVFLYDTEATAGSRLRRVSVNSDGEEGNADSFDSMVSDDGKYVVFESAATNLVSDDNNGCNDIFMYNTVTAQTFRVSVNEDGIEGNAESCCPSYATDGNNWFVSFWSDATNLTTGDADGVSDVFIQWPSDTE